MIEQPPPVLQNPALPCVTVFITRDRVSERELLVLRPLTGRPRLPDGAVNTDERPEDAALRVGRQYASTDALVLGSRLARLMQMLTDQEYAMLRPAMLRTAPLQDATMMRFTLERGMRVRMTAAEVDFVRVVYEEYALHENELAIATRRAGWVPAKSVTNQLEHHLFHLRLADNRDDWSESVRDTMLPQAVWMLLSAVSGLDSQHDIWLERARAFLSREA
jgi:hypothetical protein